MNLSFTAQRAKLRSKRCRGSTLLEIIVALTIAAVALTTLYTYLHVFITCRVRAEAITRANHYLHARAMAFSDGQLYSDVFTNPSLSGGAPLSVTADESQLGEFPVKSMTDSLSVVDVGRATIKSTIVLETNSSANTVTVSVTGYRFQ